MAAGLKDDDEEEESDLEMEDDGYVRNEEIDDESGGEGLKNYAKLRISPMGGWRLDTELPFCIALSQLIIILEAVFMTRGDGCMITDRFGNLWGVVRGLFIWHLNSE